MGARDTFGRAALRGSRPSCVAVLVLGLVVASCGGGDEVVQDPAVRDETGRVVEGGAADSLTLAVGDCIEEQAIGEIDSVPVVPCSEPHLYELFSSFEVDGDEFPGGEEVRVIANDRCVVEFETFIGFDYEDSLWDITAVTPTEATWDDLDDREVICGVFRSDGDDVVGTARGIAE